MIKNVKWIFVVLSISSLISFSFIEKNRASEGVMIGDRAPAFSLKNNHTTLDLDSLHGKYVLLSFWASYDANSRVNNILLNHALQKTSKVTMVSVSFDEYQSIYDETIKKDQIKGDNIYVDLAGNSSDVFKTYQLERGFRNFLLDENGIIIAKNLQISDLTSYLN